MAVLNIEFNLGILNETFTKIGLNWYLFRFDLFD
mgnify:CR=1 FL=1